MTRDCGSSEDGSEDRLGGACRSPQQLAERPQGLSAPLMNCFTACETIRGVFSVRFVQKIPMVEAVPI
jgi:hypothetical protein